METALFDFDLPPRLIAQQPAEPRDASRLLVLERQTGAVHHARFRELPSFLTAQDLVVTNDTRVMPAQLTARKSTGGRVAITLLQPRDKERKTWECLIRGSRLDAGRELFVEGPAGATWPLRIANRAADGTRIITSERPLDAAALAGLGRLPLPPYIKDYAGPQERYQTVYACALGSVAAPTAGLHFTPSLLDALQRRTAGVVSVTLHVGRDTFAPVRAARVEAHGLRGEQAAISAAAAAAIRRAAAQGGRIVSVGTTTTRTLEWAARQGDAQGAQSIRPVAGQADLYIWPGFAFRAVDAVVTNLHLPKSTPLFLISAFVGAADDDADAGRRMLLAAYAEAMRTGYRFYSFGDAMLIL